MKKVKKIFKWMTIVEMLIYIYVLSFFFMIIAHVLKTSVDFNWYLNYTLAFKEDFVNFEKDYLNTIFYQSWNSITYECSGWAIIKKENWNEIVRWNNIHCVALIQDNTWLHLTFKRLNEEITLHYNIK